MTHAQLVLRAESWLKRQGCGVTLRDPFRAHSEHGELPDAIGWRSSVSILVECKASRADFLADRNKAFRQDPARGMGDWRFYLCPPKLITVADLPDGWGLLWATEKTIRSIHGVPGNCGWWREKPFVACKLSENMMLVSALRRLVIRGHLPEVYDGVPVVNDLEPCHPERGPAYLPLLAEQEPLGEEFEAVWDANREKLYEP